MLRDFNSIKVRLEHLEGKNEVDLLGFQFHKGTIRTMIRKLGIEDKANFNSIKVRLELLLVDYL